MYDRSLVEINAYHILINCPEGAKPVDTLNAWNKAAAVKQRILTENPLNRLPAVHQTIPP